jgi:transcriptional regulator NrdR family protein
VRDTRHTDDNEDLRRRVCKTCKHTFYTIEFEVERDGDFLDEWCKYDRWKEWRKKND